jgi:hypothetical protein
LDITSSSVPKFKGAGSAHIADQRPLLRPRTKRNATEIVPNPAMESRRHMLLALKPVWGAYRGRGHMGTSPLRQLLVIVLVLTVAIVLTLVAFYKGLIAQGISEADIARTKKGATSTARARQSPADDDCGRRLEAARKIDSARCPRPPRLRMPPPSQLELVVFRIIGRDQTNS